MQRNLSLAFNENPGGTSNDNQRPEWRIHRAWSRFAIVLTCNRRCWLASDRNNVSVPMPEPSSLQAMPRREGHDSSTSMEMFPSLRSHINGDQPSLVPCIGAHHGFPQSLYGQHIPINIEGLTRDVATVISQRYPTTNPTTLSIILNKIAESVGQNDMPLTHPCHYNGSLEGSPLSITFWYCSNCQYYRLHISWSI